MVIAVNTRWLLKQGLEGTGWFTHSLLLRITQNHPEVTFHFLFDRKPDPSFKYGSNVVLHRLYPPARHYHLWSIWNHIRVPLKLRRIKPDLYFSPDGMAAKGWRGKQLLTVHDLNFEHHPEWIPEAVAEWLQKHMIEYAKEADHLVCVSETTLEDAHRTWGIPKEKMDVVYNAPQRSFVPTTERADLPAKGSYFVCVGAIVPRKNYSIAVRAFSKYRLQGGTSDLIFVGMHMHDDEKLTRVLEESPHREYIHFIGRREGHELNNILSNSSALLFPSLFEGFGIPIVEGMAAGTPVLCSDVSCMPEIAGGAAKLLPPEEPDLWADAMIQIENPEERQIWVERGLQRAQDFSWDNSAAKLWSIMKKMIDGTEG